MTAAVIVAIVSSAIALVSLCWNIWTGLRPNRKRLLWFTINTSLLSTIADEEGLDKLSVHWNGAEVSQPRLAKVVIANVGRVELKDTDVTISPRIELKSSRIVSGKIALQPHKSSRQSVLVALTASEQVIEAPRIALNRLDELIFTLLLDGEEEAIEPLIQAGGFRLINGDQIAERAERFNSQAASIVKIITVLSIAFLVAVIAVATFNEFFR